MTVLFIILLAVLSAAIPALHALSVFGQGHAAQIAQYICIALHILLFADLLLLSISMEIAVLIFMLSVLCYSALSAWQYHRLKKKSECSGEVDDK